MDGPTEPIRPLDAIKTYRYLRIGMIGAVVLLAVSIGIERSKVDCFQTSVSAYYYTPVQAVFVGAMLVVGFSLIVYKGRTSWEDVCLNVAGMLAPIVAVAPTTDVGACWSVEPTPLPVIDGAPAAWVVTNIDNNVNALLIAGAIGLVAGFLIAVAVNRSATAPLLEVERGTVVSLLITGAALFVGWWLLRNWDGFPIRAHGIAAVLMFVFLIGAVGGVAAMHRDEPGRAWFPVYAGVAAAMAIGGFLIWVTGAFGSHTIFALEAFEIALFAVYWIIQTVENWDERVESAPADT